MRCSDLGAGKKKNAGKGFSGILANGGLANFHEIKTRPFQKTADIGFRMGVTKGFPQNETILPCRILN